MSAIGNAFHRAAGIAVGLVIAPLPYRLRVLAARWIDYAVHPGRLAETRLTRFQLRIWNALVLGMVFFLGFPLARLTSAVRSVFRGRRRAEASYWRPRPESKQLDGAVEDPF